jgi:hypothetical protein
MAFSSAGIERIAHADIDVGIDRPIGLDAIASGVALLEPAALLGAQRLGVGGAQRRQRLLVGRGDIAIEVGEGGQAANLLLDRPIRQ